MCGIFGWQFDESALPPPERLAMLALTLGDAMDSRGGDSWGIATGKRVTRGLGRIVGGYDFVRIARATQFLGHTRKATTGDVVEANAHPFDIEGANGARIIGAHNGIVWNHKELNTKYKRDCVVDSQHIFAHVAMDLPLSDIEGYGAVEYVRTEQPRRVWLSRFCGGELAVYGIRGNAPKGTPEAKRPTIGVLWASTDSAIKDALRAARIDRAFAYQINLGELYYADLGALYTAKDKRFAAIRDWMREYTWDEDGDIWTRHAASRARACGYVTRYSSKSSSRYPTDAKGGGAARIETTLPDALTKRERRKVRKTQRAMVAGGIKEPDTAVFVPADYVYYEKAADRIVRYGFDPEVGQTSLERKTRRQLAVSRLAVRVEAPDLYPSSLKLLREWAGKEIAALPEWKGADADADAIVTALWAELTDAWRSKFSDPTTWLLQRTPHIRLAVTLDNGLEWYRLFGKDADGSSTNTDATDATADANVDTPDLCGAWMLTNGRGLTCDLPAAHAKRGELHKFSDGNRCTIYVPVGGKEVMGEGTVVRHITITKGGGK